MKGASSEELEHPFRVFRAFLEGAFSGSSPFNVGASRDLTIAPLRGTHGLSRISPPYQPLTKALLRSLLRAILFGT